MNAPLEMTEHLTDNELAALVEHGPERAERRVVEHVAECGECSEALMMASDVHEELESNLERGQFGGGGRGAWKMLASAAALAVALFLVFAVTMREKWFGPKGTEALAEASRSVKFRATEGRLSGFPFQERRVLRSGGNPEDDDLSTFRVEAEAAKILREPNANPHATAVAYLVMADEGEQAHAGTIQLLEKVLAQAKPEERPKIANDLAVALIDRGGTEDYKQAIQLMEEQWKAHKTPEIAWNRAVALTYVGGREDAARKAWADYLELDDSSPWAEEVRSRYLRMLEPNP